MFELRNIDSIYVFILQHISAATGKATGWDWSTEGMVLVFRACCQESHSEPGAGSTGVEHFELVSAAERVID